MTFKVKFFGAKSVRGEQVKQIKMEVESNDRSKVEEVLKYKHGYVVINGLKIR